jgi:hypothetical protein
MAGVLFAEHPVFLVSGIPVVPALGKPAWVESFFSLLEDFLNAPHGSYLLACFVVVEGCLILP